MSVGGRLAAGGIAFVLLVVVMAAGAGAGVASLLGGGDVAASAAATTQIPPSMLTLYQEAATICPGSRGRCWLPSARLSRTMANRTFPGCTRAPTVPGRKGRCSSSRPPSPPTTLPCRPAGPTRRAPTTRPTPSTPRPATSVPTAPKTALISPAAVYAYNHSQAYVTQVLNLAQSYGQSATQTVAASTAAQVAVAWALAQVGTPYVWGGETPGVGFDCSGLVQAAYRAAGISLPRVAQDQYDATTKLAPGDPIEPGDLVFFGGGPTDITHVGIVVGNGEMVDAPYTGADVRVEPYESTQLVGVTRI